MDWPYSGRLEKTIARLQSASGALEVQLAATRAEPSAHQSRSDEAAATLRSDLTAARQALADATAGGEAGKRGDAEHLSERNRALDMEHRTTASDTARLREEVDRLKALLGQMTNARETGSSHVRCSVGCEACACARELILLQDEVFVAMCENAPKMEAELKRLRSHAAAALEEAVLQMRRERFLRPLRPITAADQTTQAGAPTARISEAAVGSHSIGQAGAGDHQVQEDVAQGDGDGRWYDEDIGYRWYRASPEAVTNSTGQTGAVSEPAHRGEQSSSRSRRRRHSHNSSSSRAYIPPASSDIFEMGGCDLRHRRRSRSSSSSELSYPDAVGTRAAAVGRANDPCQPRASRGCASAKSPLARSHHSCRSRRFTSGSSTCMTN